jgi:hypothetical protein
MVLALAAGPAAAQGVPSGQALALWEVRWERVEGARDQSSAQMVLRFIAPGIGAPDAPGFDTLSADMDWLCQTHALPLAGLTYARADVILVNLLDRPVPRGVTDPEAVQFFGLYEIVDGACQANDNL